MPSHKKISIHFLVPYPPGTAPGQRFRFEQYLNLLERRGYAIRLLPFLSYTTNKILYTQGNHARKIGGVIAGFIRRVIQLPEVARADYVFVFREAAPLGPPLLEWIIAVLFRKRMIYDFDDAIWLPNTTHENRMAAWLKCHGKVKSLCRWSYKISCGNTFLADFARKYNPAVVVNPTTVDTENLHNPNLFSQDHEQESAFTIGWTGTHSTLPYLLPLLPVIESLWTRHPNVILMVIADKNPGWSYPFFKFVKWSKGTEISDLMKITIGVMPLPDETWAYGKCGFKALQYLSLGKPALVSPIGVNTKIVQHGVNGYLCHTTNDWLQYMEYLIQNPKARFEMGIKGRQQVINHYSVVSNEANFLSLFE